MSADDMRLGPAEAQQLSALLTRFKACAFHGVAQHFDKPGLVAEFSKLAAAATVVGEWCEEYLAACEKHEKRRLDKRI